MKFKNLIYYIFLMYFFRNSLFISTTSIHGNVKIISSSLLLLSTGNRFQFTDCYCQVFKPVAVFTRENKCRNNRTLCLSELCVLSRCTTSLSLKLHSKPISFLIKLALCL